MPPSSDLIIIPKRSKGEICASIPPNCDTLVHAALIESNQWSSGASRDIINGNAPSFIRSHHKLSPDDRVNRKIDVPASLRSCEVQSGTKIAWARSSISISAQSQDDVSRNCNGGVAWDGWGSLEAGKKVTIVIGDVLLYIGECQQGYFNYVMQESARRYNENTYRT